MQKAVNIAIAAKFELSQATFRWFTNSEFINQKLVNKLTAFLLIKSPNSTHFCTFVACWSQLKLLLFDFECS